jgi:hypothetical protein
MGKTMDSEAEAVAHGHKMIMELVWSAVEKVLDGRELPPSIEFKMDAADQRLA